MEPYDALLDLLPETLLDRFAVRFRVNKVNQVKLPGQTVFLCLLNSLLSNPIVSQRLLEATYEQLTGQTVHHSSFGKRLASIHPEYFEAIFRHLSRQFQAEHHAADARALRLKFVDATLVVLSAKVLAFGIHVASGGRAGPDHPKRYVKSVLSLSQEGLPDFLHLCREQAEANDNPALGDPMIAATKPGDLWIVDVGLFDRHRLLSIHQQGGYFLVPHKDQKLRVLKTVWEAPDPPQSATAPVGFVPASRLAATKRKPAPCRLWRVEEAVFENSNDAISPTKQAKWGQMPLLVLHGQRFDDRSQSWKPFVLLTNLPLSVDGKQAGPFPFAAVLELYRRRWEIETFFKFLKQHLSYAHLTSHSENGIKVMIFMALITALLLIWYKGISGRDAYWNVVKFWMAEAVREWTRRQLRLDLGRALRVESG